MVDKPEPRAPPPLNVNSWYAMAARHHADNAAVGSRRLAVVT